MAKVGIVLLADTESAGDMGPMANALTSAREFQEAGDEVTVIFDGAGTKWIAALSDPDHKYHALLDGVRESVKGACQYCATQYRARDEIAEAGVPLLDEYENHPSIKTLVDGGYEVITF